MRIRTFFVMLLATASLSAQQIERSVISALGSVGSTATIQISATAGEAVTTTVTSGTLVLTQGFQQPDADGATAIDPALLQVEYKFYPNPAQDLLFLEFTSSQSLSLRAELIDAQGRSIEGYRYQYRVQGSIREQWDLRPLADGQYYLRLSDTDGNLLRTHLLRTHPLRRVH
ncbi:MAG: hypothetical protein OHK0039_02980 [Bacteroidia bacterium]